MVNDLFAWRAYLSVREFLNKDAGDAVPFYARDIHIRDAEAAIPKARQSGTRNFKVKVGFDIVDEVAAVHALHSGLDKNEAFFAGANQAWDLADATDFLHGISEGSLGWREAPIPADAPDDDWARLRHFQTDCPVVP